MIKDGVKIEGSAQLIYHAEYGCVCLCNLVIGFDIYNPNQIQRLNLSTDVWKICKYEKKKKHYLVFLLKI